MSDYPHHVDDLLFNLSLDGWIPVLAHPERNTIIMQKPEIVESLIERGVLIQINSGSLTGIFGRRVRKITLDFIKKGLVQLVASDCHSYKNRPMLLSNAYGIVQHICGQERAELLFKINPRKVISGEIINPEATRGEIGDEGWRNYFNKLLKGFKKSGRKD